MKNAGTCILTSVLVVVGAINWGLVGIGMLMGKNLNLVNLLLGTWPTVEAIVYLLVGIAGVVMLFGLCACKDKCECK
ncbi:MAG: DUF378 domain-containing protein [Candidatus Gracilibacteria bacterium]|nr:DUF378 domain-containing protein [Candidatus Gracilibacteria bacterium]